MVVDQEYCGSLGIQILLQMSCDLSVLLGQQEHTFGNRFHRTIHKSTSNYHAHMKRLHPDIPLEDEGTVSSKHSITGEVSTSSKATLGVKPEPIDLVEDGPLDRFTNKDPTTKARAQKAVQ